MTNIQEIEQKLDNAVEKFRLEMNECKAELIKLKESKKEGKWKPQIGEIYYFRDDIGMISYDDFNNSTACDWRYNNISIFKTKEECERYWRFMDTVKEKSYEFSDLEWQDEYRHKYIIGYDFKEKCFYVDSLTIRKYLGEIHFKSREDAQCIIDNFKDELMKYWL